MNSTLTEDIEEFLSSKEYEHYINPVNKLSKKQLAERITNIVYCKLFVK